MAKKLTVSQKNLFRAKIGDIRDRLSGLLSIMDGHPAWDEGDAWVYGPVDEALGLVNRAHDELEAGRPEKVDPFPEYLLYRADDEAIIREATKDEWDRSKVAAALDDGQGIIQLTVTGLGVVDCYVLSKAERKERGLK